MAQITTYFAQLEIAQLVGVAGFVIYIGSFSAVQIGILSGDGLGYSCANVLAASLVLFSLTAEFNLASALIQISFVSIGLVGICRRLRQRRAASLQAQITERAHAV